jgi:hypothetical protein
MMAQLVWEGNSRVEIKNKLRLREYGARSRKEETERTADSEDKEVSLCLMV